MPSPSFRPFNSPGGQTINGVTYLLDVSSGVFRPAYTTDFAANVSISGLGVTVGAVAITGNPSVTINSGSFGFSGNVITSSQAQIPVGARSYFIAVLSGNAWINGVGPYISPFTVGGGGYDGRWTLNTAINVGITGGFVNYGYEF